jgi:hypothetical protein
MDSGNNREQGRNPKNERIPMLGKAKKLDSYTLHSLDREIGKVKEFCFDDLHWTIRYLIADTGNWLEIRQVLISPYALVAVIKEKQYIAVLLTKKQIEDSPFLDSDKPVSRQFEEVYYGYYGWPMYWGGPYMWRYYPKIERDSAKWKVSNPGGKAWDLHLRTTHAVSGHHVQAADGEIGHVDNFVIDDETWAIRYLVIDTRNWLPGKMILISPHWIKRVSWSAKKVFFDLTREAIKQSPEYSEESLMSRIMKPNCIDITIVGDIGSMDRLPGNIGT